jgi:nitroreductase
LDFETLVSDRRSIRGYKPDAVPRDVIDEIISVTKYAPSSMNTQPWHFHVVTGEPLERIREGNTEQMMAGHPPVRETSGHGAYVGVHRERQKEIAADLFAAMDIDWGDKEGRMDWTMRGFRQFDAPVSIVVTVDRLLDESPFALFDLGAATHGLVLAAWDRGLGTVINGQGIMQSGVVREHANIPDDEVIVTCVAMGYPEEAFPANDVKSSRVPNNDGLVSYVGFDD